MEKEKWAHVAIFRQTIAVFRNFSTSSLSYSQIWLSSLLYGLQPTSRPTSLIFKKRNKKKIKKKKKKTETSPSQCFLFFSFFSPNYVGLGGLAIIHTRSLAKFGYRSERKVEKLRNCKWCRTNCLNLAI